MSQQLRVYIPPHPLIKHWLAVARDVNTPSVLFRSAIIELGRWLAYEAAREWLPTRDMLVQTPLEICDATFIDAEVPVAVIPILRAGLALLEGAQTLLPLASIYHLGLQRNEETLQHSCYLNSMPEKFDPQTRVLITEPILATGGSIMLAMSELLQRGIDPSLTRVICVVSSSLALQQLGKNYPGLIVYAATIDQTINDQGLVLPGLGDAGNRIFGN